MDVNGAFESTWIDSEFGSLQIDSKSLIKPFKMRVCYLFKEKAWMNCSSPAWLQVEHLKRQSNSCER